MTRPHEKVRFVAINMKFIVFFVLVIVFTFLLISKCHDLEYLKWMKAQN